MKRLVSYQFIVLLLAAMLNARAAEPSPTPDFDEVYGLVRSHLAGMKEADLNRAAVDGLFSNLRGKVALLGGEKTAVSSTNASLGQIKVVETDAAYLRIRRVDADLAGKVRSTLDSLSPTNKVKGLVLDLRFAEGDDYAAAAAVADLFINKDATLLDWGSGQGKATKKEDAIKLPVALLVNHDTVGAPEALAAVMRDAGVGLIVGGTTAGGAMTGKEFPLKNGQRLRIADTPVKLGDGSEISPKGIKPDIEVSVSLADERAYQKDPYATLGKAPLTVGDAAASQVDSTNRPARRMRPSEADLVRARREGVDMEELERNREPDQPLLRDPALARAVDVLKGLAVVRRTRS